MGEPEVENRPLQVRGVAWATSTGPPVGGRLPRSVGKIIVPVSPLGGPLAGVGPGIFDSEFKRPSMPRLRPRAVQFGDIPGLGPVRADEERFRLWGGTGGAICPQ